MKTVLVTGGCGFIGSNFLPLLLEQTPNIRVVNLDKLTYAGNTSNTSNLKGHGRYEFFEGDICDWNTVQALFKKYDFRGVYHFAAESHVDNSISGPRAFVETNIVGTFNLLEAARDHWMEAPKKIKPGYEQSRFLHISTDEVYGTLGEVGFFTEKTPYAPNSPYSATKAGSDFLVRAYFHTYGMNVVTTNCSNNYGPRQHDEKLIPTIIRRAIAEQPIPIYGNGKNVRDWLYVEDHGIAILNAFAKGQPGETYNIGTRNERTNIEIANQICSALDTIRPRKDGLSYKALITYVTDRAGHDFRYAIDPQKIETEIGWRPAFNFEHGLRLTIEWYLKKYL